MAKTRAGDGADAVLRMLSTLGTSQGYDLVSRLLKGACSTHAEGYSVLYTLESRGLIEGRIEPATEGGERRWYTLTIRGHGVLRGLTVSAPGVAVSVQGGVA